MGNLAPAEGWARRFLFSSIKDVSPHENRKRFDNSLIDMASDEKSLRESRSAMALKIGREDALVSCGRTIFGVRGYFL